MHLDALHFISTLTKMVTDSFQDTVVALQALSAFAELVYYADAKIKIAVLLDKENTYAFNINPENALLLQRSEVNKRALSYYFNVHDIDIWRKMNWKYLEKEKNCNCISRILILLLMLLLLLLCCCYFLFFFFFLDALDTL